MKTFSVKTDLLTGEEYFEVYLRGKQILTDPLLNKASSFTQEERLSLGLDGLLRTTISDLEAQRIRSYEMYKRKSDEIEKYIFLQSLLNRNETLFYSMLCNHLTEMLPIVYTPTVGKACQMLSHITRDYRGVYISPENIAHIDDILKQVALPEVYLIVVTDGERILGLGDLGSDGMGIPVGKINLYVAAGGLHPACCLPVCLDTGTNNEKLLSDPLYLGYRKQRLIGKEYDEFVEKFVLGIKRNFPNVLLQWEDFAKHNAFRLLERYSERIPSFNDDIQGTGACALAALISAMKIKKEKFSDQKFVIVGMGQAGVGIASNIFTMLKEEGATDEFARSRIFAFDFNGLLTDRTPGLSKYQKPFAQKHENISNWICEDVNSLTLNEVVQNSKTTVLIGVTATAGLFNNEILSQLSLNTEKPIVFALSNPTSKSECTAEEVAVATKGKGLFAAGSPFPPVDFNGKTIYSSQCNNMFIFPGVGLGALISRASRITTKMFLQASKSLSQLVTQDQLNQNKLLPELSNIREVSQHVALAVAIEARDSGVGRILSNDELTALVKKAQWEPKYYQYRPGIK